MLPPSNSGFRKRHRRAFREDITLPSPLADLDRKKAEIAYEALYAFAFEGYHKTTLGAIARMCRIGRTTIY
jgi:AcrR family transcriptional regulator